MDSIPCGTLASLMLLRCHSNAALPLKAPFTVTQHCWCINHVSIQLKLKLKLKAEDIYRSSPQLHMQDLHTYMAAAVDLLLEAASKSWGVQLQSSGSLRKSPGTWRCSSYHVTVTDRHSSQQLTKAT
jgi:hypothetical protein